MDRPCLSLQFTEQDQSRFRRNGKFPRQSRFLSRRKLARPGQYEKQVTRKDATLSTCKYVRPSLTISDGTWIAELVLDRGEEVTVPCVFLCLPINHRSPKREQWKRWKWSFEQNFQGQHLLWWIKFLQWTGIVSDRQGRNGRLLHFSTSKLIQATSSYFELLQVEYFATSRTPLSPCR